MFKFLPGIIFLQLMTAGLILIVVNGINDFQIVIVLLFVALLCVVLVAFWFASMARQMYNEEYAAIREQHAQDREILLKEAAQETVTVIQEKSQMQDRYARERERLLLDAEREKAKVVAESYEKIEKASRKAQSKANFKVGAAFAFAAGAGGIMIFSQLVTLGTMVLVASGSGLSGYLLRVRQERHSKLKYINGNEMKMLESDIGTRIL